MNNPMPPKSLIPLLIIVVLLIAGCKSSEKSVHSSNKILYFQLKEWPINERIGTTIIPDSDHIILPTPIVKDTPSYHPDAISAKKEGYVMILLIVDSTGFVKKGIVGNTNAEIFISDCLSSAVKWIFSPLFVDGVPRGFVAQLIFRFILDNSGPKVILPS
jgi:hypothetical protein